MKTVQRTCLLALALGGLLAPDHLRAQVTYDQILRAADEPQNWLTYNGTYSSQRHSGLRSRSRRRTWETSSRSGCFRIRCSVPGSRTRSSSTGSCTSPSDPTTSWPSMLSQVGCSGYTGIGQPTMLGSAVVPTTAVWPSWTTRCSWARWTLGSSRSTRPMAGRSGTSKSRTQVRRIRSPWRPWW